VIGEIRSGRRPVPVGCPAQVVADHRDLDGELLPSRVAAVELLNLLRPTVATALYLTCVAHALEAHPGWARRLADGDGDEDLAFVEEVRRHYPFFPALIARVRHDFEWHGHRFARGRRVLLDVYGTNHDPRHWDDPAAFDPERFLGAAPDPFGFIPQGGGDAAVHHRCPGEPITVRLMLVAVDLLVRHMTYEPDLVDKSVDFSRLPALPAGGFPIRVLHPQGTSALHRVQ
jgi:fatty-acid peroxygenase